MKKHAGKLSLVAIVVVIGGAIWYANVAAEQANADVTIEPNVKGNPEAEVVLVKYSDFQCPACQQAAGVVAEVMDTYGDEIRFEYRHYPLVTLHPLALPAARATEAAAQQGKFWEMHDLLFANQNTWSAAPNPTALFMTYAEELSLDTAMFRRHMSASHIKDHVQAQFAEARKAGYTGTPTFVLNGERMQFESYNDFIAQIEAALGVTAATSTAPATATTTSADLDLEFGI